MPVVRPCESRRYVLIFAAAGADGSFGKDSSDMIILFVFEKRVRVGG